MANFTEKVTVVRPLPYPLNTMASFVRWLEGKHVISATVGLSDEELVTLVREFYDIQHGED